MSMLASLITSQHEETSHVSRSASVNRLKFNMFSSPSHAGAITLTVLGLAVVVVAQALAGSRFVLGIFAIVPVVYATWYVGRLGGIVAAVFGSCVPLLEGFDLSIKPGNLWNALFALAAFALVVFLTERIRQWHLSALENVQGRYTRVVEAAVEGILAVHLDGSITFANTRAANLFHRPAEELVGRNLLTLVHGDASRVILLEQMKRDGAQKNTAEIEFGGNAKKTFWSLVTFTPTMSYSGKQDGMMLLLTDISDLKRSQQELVRQYREISAMQRLSSGLAQSLDLASRLESAVEITLEVTGFEAGLIYLMDESQSNLQLRFHRGIGSPEFLKLVKRWQVGKGVTGQTALTGIPTFIEDALTNPLMDQTVRDMEDIRGFASIPLVSKERVEGVLNVVTYKPVNFTPSDQLMLQTLGKQVGISLENARLFETARQREHQIRQLSIDIVQIQEEERRRFARELHDGLSQLLATLKINTELALKHSERDFSMTQKHLREVIALANEAQIEAKQIAYDLRPAILDDFGLKAAIVLHATNFERRTGIAVDLHMPPTDARYGSLIETTLYRIVQELLTNVAKHSKATRVTIQLLIRNDVLALFLADNGEGFDRHQAFGSQPDQPRFGLRNVRERVEFLGGMFRTESWQGTGSEFMIELPIKDESTQLLTKEKAT